VSKEKRMVLTYCEGDWILCACDDDEAFNKEVEECCRYYGEYPEVVTIGSDGVKEFYQDRKEFFI
jgi:hypothetical protein